jgi:hypothetical protein
MQELVELSAEDRDLAMSRFHLLQAHFASKEVIETAQDSLVIGQG